MYLIILPVLFRAKSRKSRSYSKDRHKRSRSSSREVIKSYKARRRSSSSSASSSSRSPSKSRRSSSSSSSSSSVSPVASRRSSTSKSESPPIKKEVVVPKPPLPRYYGRKRSDQSSSDLEDGSDEEPANNMLAQTP